MITAIVGALVSALLGAISGGVVSHLHWRRELKVMNRRLRADRTRTLKDRRNERRHRAILAALDAVGDMSGLVAQHEASWSVKEVRTMQGDELKAIHHFETARAKLRVTLSVLGRMTKREECDRIVELHGTLGKPPAFDDYKATLGTLVDMRDGIAALLD